MLSEPHQRPTGRFIAIWEEERRRISRELHDDLGQRLALLGMQIEQLEQKLPAQEIAHGLKILRESVVELDRDLHRMCYRLHPAVLDQLGLMVALKSFCRQFSQFSHVQATLVHNTIPDLPKSISLCVYRLIQEALHNVAAHSQATEATVTLRANAVNVEVVVQDSGIGFDTHSARSKGGLGLIFMKERVLGVGGRYSLHSSLREGTIVKAVIPRASAEAFQTSQSA